MTDEELLQQFAATRSNEAFAEIVDRHLDLVFSVAQRIVRTPDLAQDVAQAVFIELARQASAVASTPVLPWLHAVARRRAIDAVRSESRRRARQAVAVELAAMNREDSDWSQVAPLLDEAVSALPRADRHAVLLRYFQNKSLREIGQRFGVSDDAAQKRVARVIDQLRSQFVARGLTTSATSMAAALSAHAVQQAPAGLAGSICGAAAMATPAATTGFWIMTTTKKLALAAALLGSAGTLWLEVRAIAEDRQELVAVRKTVAAVERETRVARAVVDRTTAQRPAAASEPRATPEDAAAAAQMQAWLERMDRLRTAFREHPELSIPELAALDEATWFSLGENLDLSTEEKVRDAMARLRSLAENWVANQMAPALTRYAAAHDGLLPETAAELAEYFRPSIAPALLKRYEMIHRGPLVELKGRDRMNIVAERSPVDADRDRIWHIGANGHGSEAAAAVAVREAKSAYAAKHNGVSAVTATELLPYLPWPLTSAKLQETFDGTVRP